MTGMYSNYIQFEKLTSQNVIISRTANCQRMTDSFDENSKPPSGMSNGPFAGRLAVNNREIPNTVCRLLQVTPHKTPSSEGLCPETRKSSHKPTWLFFAVSSHINVLRSCFVEDIFIYLYALFCYMAA
jgi:hypothetical protein